MNSVPEIPTPPIAALTDEPFQMQIAPVHDYHDLTLQSRIEPFMFEAQNCEFPPNVHPRCACPIESKEQIHLNADLIHMALANSNNTVSIKAPPENGSELDYSHEDMKALGPNEYSKVTNGGKVVTFKIRDICKHPKSEGRIQIYVADSAGCLKYGTISVKLLRKMVSHYPIPILLEIGNIEQTIFPRPSIDELPDINPMVQNPITILAFDLRDLFKDDMPVTAGPRVIRGVLISQFPRWLIYVATGLKLKPRSRIRQRAIFLKHANAGGKYEMAVAPDQYGSKRINVRQAPFDSTEKGNIRQARIDEMKEILLTAMESNVKALKFMLEPEEPVSPDIRLSPGKLSISISMNAVDRDVCNTLSSRPLDMKINPEGANIKIPEVRVFDDKLTHIDGDLTIRSLTGKFDGNGRGAKKTWRH